MSNKHDPGKIIDPDGNPIRPLSYRQPGRVGARRKGRLPIALIGLSIVVGLFLLVRPAARSPEPVASLADSVVSPTFTMPASPTDIHGGRIIFTCTRDDFNHICMVDADGSKFTQITNGDTHNYYPVFLPHGNTVLYASNRAGSFDIYMLMLSTMKLYQLTQGIGNAFAPVFSPEENAIYFINRPAENPPALWRMESTGKDPRSLYSGTGAIVGMDLSPDGTRIALVMGDDQTGNYGIYLFDPAAKILVSENLAQNMTGITGSLDWSPDGKYLLFCAGILGDKDIFRLELTTGSIVQLTNGGNNAAAVYSPDGLLIAFNSLRNQDQADIFVMKSDGTYQRHLTTNPEPDWQPQWEP